MPILGKQGPVSKGVSSAIGLATEAFAHHKESKEAEKAGHSHGSPESKPFPFQQQDENAFNESSDDEDEESWIRDETETQLDPTRADDRTNQCDNQGGQSIDAIVDDFVKSHPPPAHIHKKCLLSQSVIIPQRRPGMRSRGFVRAYAPALDNCGIDQKTFMDFHEGFHKATNKQGWFHVVNIAIAISVLAETAAIAPSVTVHATAFLVHTSIEAGRRTYISHETNKFLDSMNDKLFRPHGLYAMIMSYKPKSPHASQEIDIKSTQASQETDIANAVSSRADKHASSLRTTSGKTRGAVALPEAAPLEFPLLQAAPDAEKANAFKRAANFAADYSDRRAQARFERENSDAAQLNVAPRKEFASRWADPNHPVNKGGLITVITGGAIDPEARLRQRRACRDGLGGGSVSKRQESQGLIKKATRKLHEDVLYLMVVNMPSEEELQAAAQLMRKAQEGGSGAKLPPV